MEIYAQDDAFDVKGVFENFNSLIWTDRYTASGDVELSLPRGEATNELLKQSTYLKIPTSKETMVIETVDEEEVVKVTGRSLSSIMDRRICDVGGGTPAGNTLTAFLRYLVGANIGQAAAIPERRVPLFNIDTAAPVDFIDPTVFDLVKYGDGLYDAVQKLCAEHSLGFTVRNNLGSATMSFILYNGFDHTGWAYSTVFSESIGNIQDVRRLKSDKGLKNVAVVNLPPWDTSVVGVGELWRVHKGADRKSVV